MGIRQELRLRDAFVRIGASVALIVGYLLIGVFVSQALYMFGIRDSVVGACVMDALVAGVLLFALRGAEASRRPVDARDVALMACGVFIVWLVGIMSSTSLFCTLKDAAWVDYTASFSDAGLGATAALSLLFAPVAEELMMRRVLYSYLRQIGIVFAMLVTSFLFAGMHGTLVHLPFTFLLGLFLCAVFEFSGSVWACVACHCAANAMSLFVAPYVSIPESLLHPVVCAILFAAAVAAIFVCTHLVYRMEVEHV